MSKKGIPFSEWKYKQTKKQTWGPEKLKVWKILNNLRKCNSKNIKQLFDGDVFHN